MRSARFQHAAGHTSPTHAAARPHHRVAPGVPLFLRASRAAEKGADAHEREARRIAESGASHATPAPHAGSLRDSAQASEARRLAASAGPGERLPVAWRERAQKFGVDGESVRIHRDAGAEAIARERGANALTAGHDIFFNSRRYAPGTQAGDSLTAHELTHVAQQGGEPRAVQCDLMQTMPTALGHFEIDMARIAVPQPGLDGHIRFFPEPTGPYSTRIGLIQTVNVTDVAGVTTAAGDPMDWSRVDARTDVAGSGEESGRAELMTQGTGAAPRGWFVDLETSRRQRGESVTPHYLESRGAIAGRDQYGWLRSPTDTAPAILEDAPKFSVDTDFEFETVAKGEDNQVVYGAAERGFGIRSGVVQNEYATAHDATSTAFADALERFRGYYAHEPVILYFDTNIATPMAGEASKLADVPDYLSRYPDVRIEITGYADERGSDSHNSALSQNRALSVQQLLIDMGVDASRLDVPIGMSETAAFSAGSPAAAAGSLTANRRVVIRFVRTATSFINAP